MGPKTRNYLKITKNIENNPKLIKKGNRNRIYIYDFMAQKGAIFVQLLLFWLFWPKFGPKISHKMSPKTLNENI